MRWPWQRMVSTDRLIVSWSVQTLSYVRARAVDAGRYEVLAMGVEPLGQGTEDDLVEKLRGKGLMGLDAQVMLRPEQYQVLQVEMPAVTPEELRSAVRYQIREMVDLHIDDITLDVLRVGDGQQKGAGNVFVVVAANAVINDVQKFGRSMEWPISVIDVQETAQRNLQTLLAQRDGVAEKADAALIISGDRQAVLTISANGELFYTRRLELPDGFMELAWGEVQNATAEAVDSYTPVTEYVPGYAVEQGNSVLSASGGGDSDRAQRILVEIQRSLDLWDRSWSGMPLAGLRVYAGERSVELAQWLSREIGQTVTAMDLNAFFPGLEGVAPDVRDMCLPLLGVLMRTPN